MNDKQMIENAGIGIAMGQSTPTLKEVADYIDHLKRIRAKYN